MTARQDKMGRNTNNTTQITGEATGIRREVRNTSNPTATLKTQRMTARQDKKGESTGLVGDRQGETKISGDGLGAFVLQLNHKS